MDVFVLAPSLPFPPTDGGKIRVYNLLKQLARRHSVTMIALETEPTDAKSVERLRDDGVQAVLVRRKRPQPPPLTARAVFRAVARDIPLSASKYSAPAYADAIRAEWSRRRFDLVVFEMIHMATYLPLVRQLTSAPAVLSTQNVDSDVWRRAADHQPSAFRRVVFRRQALAFERMERREGPRFDGITAASERDAAMYRDMLPSVPVETVDNGVDLSGYKPNPDAEEPDTFVYTGSYDWVPNADAVERFCVDIWPLIRAELPDARFLAVGKRASDAMMQCDERDGVSIVGRVPEIMPYIARAAVYVVPLRIGGGTRLKILEALGMGKAVVSTSIGAEALDLEAGRHLVIANDPQRFAAESVRLARNVAARRALGNAGRRRVEERYGWENIGERMIAFYESIAGA